MILNYSRSIYIGPHGTRSGNNRNIKGRNTAIEIFLFLVLFAFSRILSPLQLLVHRRVQVNQNIQSNFPKQVIHSTYDEVIEISSFCSAVI